MSISHSSRGTTQSGAPPDGIHPEITVTVALKEAPKPKELAEKLHLFIRTYRPHAAREDTVMFPALCEIVTAEEFYSTGQEFEDKEAALLGKVYLRR